MKYFATAVPGVGPILNREIGDLHGLQVVGGIEFDGRNDVVAFDASTLSPSRFRTAEDVYVSVGEAKNQELSPLLRSLIGPDEIERSLSVYASINGALKARMTYRVVARVSSERLFTRTKLRSEATDFIGRLRPRWDEADPADLEFWLLQTRPDVFRLGLRLTKSVLRTRGGRNVERPGALKPTVAAAMVYLSGEPTDLPLLDPACGSGTLLSEAIRSGWRVIGSDKDEFAIEIARTNVASAALVVADLQKTPFRANSFGALVSNFPFGKQYQISRSPGRWFTAALREGQRAVVDGGPLVILAPGSRAFMDGLEAVPELETINRFNIQLKGQPTALWELRNVL